MTAKSPVILILGAGPNVGQSVAQKFASKGYKVALAARSLKESNSTEEQLIIPSDLSKTDDIVSAFAKVKEVFGIPSVVVYNGEISSPRTAITVNRLTHCS
jgi:NAD(P)-dependent dehydrogenase (short-subunit alcohol dehydrogenase family)